MKKIGYIDLLDIKDPNGVAKRGTKDGVFKFPFVTIEDVDLVDGEHIVVANDNNLPYSAGRKPNVHDDNEFILLRVPELLRARKRVARIALRSPTVAEITCAINRLCGESDCNW